jgi:hypothetical protein
MTANVPNEDRADLARFLREMIVADRYPLSPRVRRQGAAGEGRPRARTGRDAVCVRRPPGRPSMVMAKGKAAAVVTFAPTSSGSTASIGGTSANRAARRSRRKGGRREARHGGRCRCALMTNSQNSSTLNSRPAAAELSKKLSRGG